MGTAAPVSSAVIPETLPAEFDGFDPPEKSAQKEGKPPQTLPADFAGFDKPAASPQPLTQPEPLGQKILNALPLETLKEEYVDPFEKIGELGSQAGRALSSSPDFDALTAARTGQIIPNKVSPQEQGVHAAAGELLGSTVADPRNWPFLASGGVANPIAKRAIAAGFTGLMGKGAVEAAGQYGSVMDQPVDPAEKSRLATHAIAAPIMAGLAGAGIAERGKATVRPEAPAPQPRIYSPAQRAEIINRIKAQQVGKQIAPSTETNALPKQSVRQPAVHPNYDQVGIDAETGHPVLQRKATPALPPNEAKMVESAQNRPAPQPKPVEPAFVMNTKGEAVPNRAAGVSQAKPAPPIRGETGAQADAARTPPETPIGEVQAKPQPIVQGQQEAPKAAEDAPSQTVAQEIARGELKGKSTQGQEVVPIVEAKGGQPISEGLRQEGVEQVQAPQLSPAEKAQVGQKEPETGRPIVQPSENAETNRQLALEAAPEVAQKLEGLGIQGAKFERLRPEKKPDRVEDKVAEGKPPETISDFGAAQISVDSQQSKAQTIEALKKQFKVVSVDDYFDRGKEDKGGYRAASVQIQAENGSGYEIQVVPKDLYGIIEQTHQHYAAARDAEAQGDQKKADAERAIASGMNDEAWEKFQSRNQTSAPQAAAPSSAQTSGERTSAAQGLSVEDKSPQKPSTSFSKGDRVSVKGKSGSVVWIAPESKLGRARVRFDEGGKTETVKSAELKATEAKRQNMTQYLAERGLSDSIDHSVLSPSGTVSERARNAMLRRENARLDAALKAKGEYRDAVNRGEIIDPSEQVKPEEIKPDTSERDSLLHRADELEGLANRGMKPRAYKAEAEKLRAQAQTAGTEAGAKADTDYMAQAHKEIGGEKYSSAVVQRAQELKDQVAGPAQGKTGEMALADIAQNPHRFQYKLGTDAEGVGSLLKEQSNFNPDLAGVITVWRDPADGKMYVVNGHHRLELAKRTGQKNITVRHVAAKDQQEARAIGALQNIAEGRGTAVDAAKFLRDSGMSPDDLKAKGISMGEATASKGVALSKLEGGLFNQVVQGDMPVERAVAIGEATADHAEQKAIVDLIDKQEAKGKKVSNDTLRELVRFVKGSEQKTETAGSLFGEEQITRSLALEKAEISSYIKQQLAKDKRLFGYVSKGGRAEELERGNNIIDVKASGRIASEAEQGEEVYNKLSERAGPIADVLDDAARRLAEGENAHAVKQEAYNAIRTELSQAVGGSQRTSLARSSSDAARARREASVGGGEEKSSYRQSAKRGELDWTGGLSEEQLSSWSKSKSLDIEDGGTQDTLFGESEKMYRFVRQDAEGQSEKALVPESQVSRLASEGSQNIIKALQRARLDVPGQKQPWEQTRDKFLASNPSTAKAYRKNYFDRNRNEQRAMSSESWRWEAFVRDAIETGKDVPADVRKEYEELHKVDEEAEAQPKEESPQPSLFGKGTTLAAHNPASVISHYWPKFADWAEKKWNDKVAEPLIQKVIQNGRKYQDEEAVDPEFAQQRRTVDYAGSFHREVAKKLVADIIDGLSREQERLLTLIADKDSRENLEANHPEEFQQAENDPKIQAALKKYRAADEQITQVRQENGGVILNEGDFFHRVYDKYTSGLGHAEAQGERQPEPFSRVIKPKLANNASRQMTAEYHYQNGLHEVGPSLGTRFVGAHLLADRNALAMHFLEGATEVKDGEREPQSIEYQGKKFYSPEVASDMRRAGKKAESYARYEYSGTKFLGPEKLVKALDSMGGGDLPQKGKLQTWWQKNIILGIPFGHAFNETRRLLHMYHGGTASPIAWANVLHDLNNAKIKDRALSGTSDPTYSMLLRNGAIFPGGVKEYDAYVADSVDVSKWKNLFTEKQMSRGHEWLFGPGGIDQRARLIAADFIKSQKPNWTDAQIAERVNEQLGRYSRLGYSELQEKLARWTMFPGWDFSSLNWVIRHPIRTTVPSAFIVMLANNVIHSYGHNRDEDRFDFTRIHYGQYSASTNLLNEGMANSLGAVPLGVARDIIAKRPNGQIAGNAAKNALRSIATPLNYANPAVRGVVEAGYGETLGKKPIIESGHKGSFKSFTDLGKFLAGRVAPAIERAPVGTDTGSIATAAASLAGVRINQRKPRKHWAVGR